MIRILVIDDHPLIRRGIRQTILEEPGMAVTGEAEDGTGALALLKEQEFEVMVLDLSLPAMSGLEILNEVKARYPKLPVLILSMHSEDHFALRVIKSGASGFLSKDTNPEILIQAIKKLAGGGKFFSHAVAEQIINRADSTQSPLHEGLSHREFHVMQLVGQGKTPREIAEVLNISPKTVSTYKVRIFRKMQFKSTSELVQYCLENSLIEKPITPTK